MGYRGHPGIPPFLSEYIDNHLFEKARKNADN
jgi:hypothetical protein